MAGGGIAFGTIASAGAFPLARAVAASARAHHPDARITVLLADRTTPHLRDDEPFELLRLEELGLSPAERADLAFRRTEPELSYALTADLLLHLLDGGADTAIFLKQESFVTAPLDSVAAALERSAIVLTPHLLAVPEGADPRAREQAILRSGTINGGIVGVADRPAARRFLDWWASRCHDRCSHDVTGGLHYEQRWLELAVTVFGDDVELLRDPGVNVGHWNLPDRALEGASLVRFSGFEPGTGSLTRHDDRVQVDELEGASVVTRYARLLEASSAGPAPEYGLATFDDGAPVPLVARQVLDGLAQDERTAFGDPFRDGPGSFRAWLTEPADDVEPPISRLWLAVHQRRTDVAAAMPDPLGDDRDALAGWIESTGRVEHGIDPRLG